MNQDQLSAFCRSQQEAGRTVDAIWMPGADLRELSAEVAGDCVEVTFPDGAPKAPFAGGMTVSHFKNPASGVAMPLGLMPEGGEPMASVRVAEGANTFLVPVG